MPSIDSTLIQCDLIEVRRVLRFDVDRDDEPENKSIILVVIISLAGGLVRIRRLTCEGWWWREALTTQGGSAFLFFSCMGTYSTWGRIVVICQFLLKILALHINSCVRTLYRVKLTCQDWYWPATPQIWPMKSKLLHLSPRDSLKDSWCQPPWLCVTMSLTFCSPNIHDPTVYSPPESPVHTLIDIMTTEKNTLLSFIK